MMVQTINLARHRCWILTPYFVPDVAVIKALQLASMRGVDVRILIPANPDKRFVWWAAHSYLFEVAVAGVRMYTYRKGYMHQKVFLVDDALAGIGTVNLDNRCPADQFRDHHGFYRSRLHPACGERCALTILPLPIR